MEMIADHAPCLYLQFDDDSIIRSCNSMLCQTLHYAKEQLIGAKLELIMPVSSRIFYNTHLFPLLTFKGLVEELFLFFKGGDGIQVPVLLSISRNETSSGWINACIGIRVENRKKFEDDLINSKKAAEKALRENTELTTLKGHLLEQTELLEKQLQLAQRQHHDLTQLTYAVTHNLQEPLRKILTQINIIRRKDEESHSIPGFQKIERNAFNLKNIISGLQEFMWLNEAKLNPARVNLNHILESITRRLNTTNADVLTVMHDELPEIVGDAKQLELLFFHLLNNAIQYRKPEQHAVVTVNHVFLNKNKFRNIQDRFVYAEHLQLSFEDNGIGFNQQSGVEIFELFKRLHRNDGGGVGLALCRIVAENHSGTISASGVPGKGASFVITLPVEPD